MRKIFINTLVFFFTHCNYLSKTSKRILNLSCREKQKRTESFGTRNLVIFTFHKSFRKLIRELWLEHRKGRDNLGYLGVEGMILIKWILSRF